MPKRVYGGLLDLLFFGIPFDADGGTEHQHITVNELSVASSDPKQKSKDGGATPQKQSQKQPVPDLIPSDLPESSRPGLETPVDQRALHQFTAAGKVLPFSHYSKKLLVLPLGIPEFPFKPYLCVNGFVFGADYIIIPQGSYVYRASAGPFKTIECEFYDDEEGDRSFPIWTFEKCNFFPPAPTYPCEYPPGLHTFQPDSGFNVAVMYTDTHPTTGRKCSP